MEVQHKFSRQTLTSQGIQAIPELLKNQNKRFSDFYFSGMKKRAINCNFKYKKYVPSNKIRDQKKVRDS